MPRFLLFVIATVALAATLLVSQPTARLQVGPLADGGFLLNSGWRIEPAGKQVALDTFPMSTALSPDGKYLLVLNGGYRPPSLSVLDTGADMKEISRVAVADGWLGLTFAPGGGNRVYVGGGSRASVFEFTFDGGALKPARIFAIVADKDRTWQDFVGDVTLSPDGRLLYAAMLYRDEIAVVNPQSGMVVDRFKTGRRPYRILFHPDGKSFFVSSWTSGSVYHQQTSNGDRLATIRLGPHTTDMLWLPKREGAEGNYAARLFVTAGNTNNVYVVGVSPAKDLAPLETINVALSVHQPAGMTPSALAANAAGTRLYVVCSDANAVAVADIGEERSRVAGFIPTGWYPTAVRSLADGRLVVLNGRGLRSYSNPNGPNPTRRVAPVHEGGPVIDYVGRIQTGTASVIAPFDDVALAEYTRSVQANSLYRDAKLDDAGVPRGNPVPTVPGASSPIEHVIYVIKENRTYDQVLGDLKTANGEPSLVLFGEEITPNHHKLAREFVTLDNFYVNADVSADGHNWSTAAIAPDYVQKMWPNSYAGRRKHYDYEGQEPTTSAPAGRLWNNALAAGLTIRNYGWWCTNKPKAAPDGIQIEAVRDAALRPFTNMKYRSFDLEYLDTERVKVFLDDLAGFERSGAMPRLIFLRLGNDHTSGTSAGHFDPRSMVADNDAALGMAIEALSKSRFWARTAVFILEDDAQNGADHVDSHRSPAFVISPYTRRGIVDSTLYNTAAMLRTIELILGLQPMTMFDAAARPMWASFSETPNASAYTAEKPRIPLDRRNPVDAPAAARSARLDFDEADRADDDELNDILWRAIRGSDPPAPVRSYFSR
jgi:DNA-binding beta-propeller fold protein YncE